MCVCIFLSPLKLGPQYLWISVSIAVGERSRIYSSNTKIRLVSSFHCLQTYLFWVLCNIICSSTVQERQILIYMALLTHSSITVGRDRKNIKILLTFYFQFGEQANSDSQQVKRVPNTAVGSRIKCEMSWSKRLSMTALIILSEKGEKTAFDLNNSLFQKIVSEENCCLDFFRTA